MDPSARQNKCFQISETIGDIFEDRQNRHGAGKKLKKSKIQNRVMSKS